MQARMDTGAHTCTYTQGFFRGRDGGYGQSTNSESLIIIHINLQIKFLIVKLCWSVKHTKEIGREKHRLVELAYEESITILNVYVPNNRATKQCETKIRQSKREIKKLQLQLLTLITLSITDRPVKKDLER